MGRSGGACLRTAGGSLGFSTCKGCGSTSSEVAPPRSRAQGPKRFSPRGLRVVMPIDPNRPWGRSSASAAAPSPCFASPARPDSDAAKKEAPKAGQLSPQPPRPSRPSRPRLPRSRRRAPPQPSRRRPRPPPPGPSARRRRRRSWRNRRSPPWRSPLLGLGSQELPP